MAKKAGEEVVADVFGSDRDRSVDDDAIDTVKPGEGAADGGADDDPADKDGGEDEGDDGDEGQHGSVPVSEHVRERKKFKSQIETLTSGFEELKKELQARDLKIAQLEGRVSATPQQRQPQRRAPSFRDNPEAATRHVVGSVAEQNEHRFLNYSESQARRTHGAELVNEAKAAAKQLGILGEFRHADDPYGELVEWHKEQKSSQTLREKLKGKSFEDYEKEIRADERKKAAAEAKKAQEDDLPGSLASSTASGRQGGHMSQKAVALSVFGSDRDRKRA